MKRKIEVCCRQASFERSPVCRFTDSMASAAISCTVNVEREDMKEKTKRLTNREKYHRRLDELSRNVSFTKRIKQLRQLVQKFDEVEVELDLEPSPKIRKEIIELIQKTLFEFKLDYSSLPRIVEMVHTEKDVLKAEDDQDLCKIIHVLVVPRSSKKLPINYSEHVETMVFAIDEDWYKTATREEKAELILHRSYPVSIVISPDAGIENIISFLRKNRPLIEELLSQHRAKPAGRKRRMEERDNFIWENQSRFPSRYALAKFTREKFNQSINFDELQVNKIIEKMNKRRGGAPDT